MRFFLGPPPKYSDPTFAQDLENWLLRLVDELKRVEANLDQTWFPTKDTDDLAEGVTNKYYTTERAQDDIGGILADTASIDMAYDDATPSIRGTVLPGGVDHALLANLNSANYTHLTAVNHTDLTDGGATILHTHAGVSVSNVTGPAVAVDGDVAVFDGITGKIIRDSGINETNLFLLSGRAGGQIAYGGTGSGEDIYIYSTKHATRGTIFLNDQLSSTVTKSDPSGVWTGQLFLTELTATEDYVSQGRGLQFQSSLYPAVTKIIAAHRSVEGTAYNFGAGTVTRMTGMQFAGGCHGTGPITTLNIVNLATYGPGAGTTGTVNGLSISNLALYNTPTTVYAINIDASTTAVGTLKYGLYIGDQSGATTNYSIYTAGGASVLNSGGIAIVPLTLKGHAGQTGNLLQLQPSTGAHNHVAFDADGDMTITKEEVESTISLDVYGTAGVPNFYGRKAANTIAVPQAVAADKVLVRMLGWGHNGTDWVNCGGVTVETTAQHSLTEGGTRVIIRNILEGTVSLAHRLIVDEAGNLQVNLDSVAASAHPDMLGGLVMASSGAPSSVAANRAALYTGDVNAAAGYHWWHGMGEMDVAHVMVGAILHADTGDPTVSHESAISLNYGDDCVGIVQDGAWKRLLATNIVSYDDNLIFYDDEVIWN